MQVFGFIYIVFKKFPRRFVSNLIMLIIAGLIGTLSIFSVTPLIDYFMNTDIDQASKLTRYIVSVMESFGIPVSLVSLFAIFFVLHVIKNGVTLFVYHALLKTLFIVRRDFLLGSYDDMYRAQWLFFTGSNQGTLLNTFIRELQNITEGLKATIFCFAYSIQLLFYLIAPFYLSWQITTIGLTVALIFMVPSLLLSKVAYRIGKVAIRTSNILGTNIHEGLSLAKVIMGFGKQQDTINRLAQSYDAHRQAGLKSQTLRMAIPRIYEPLGLLVLAVSLFSARWFSIPIADVGAFFWALAYCLPVIGSILTEKNTISNLYPSYEQLRDIRERARQLQQRDGKRIFSGFSQEIVIDHLTFAYPDQAPVLKDICTQIPKGKMIALVGSSGAGKSTLIDLIMGFYEPSGGHITFDGIPLQEYNIESYRHQIGYVPQVSVLFDMSIRDNLLWAKGDATDQDIALACRQANAEAFILTLPDGYDTIVGDRGVRLSGGQAQRIALARAILRKPELLILDEATSSLDTESERLIQHSIEHIARETTIVVIAHRLSTIMGADWIYVLDDGLVVEEGTYEDLLNKKKHFSRMVQMQELETTVNRT